MTSIRFKFNRRRDMTPVAMLALDQFVLWVNEESPYQTAKAYLDGLAVLLLLWPLWSAARGWFKARDSVVTA